MVLAVRRMHQDGKKTQVVLSVRLGYRNRLGAVEQSGRLRRRQAVQLDRTELQLLRHALLSGGRNVLRQPARQGRRMRSQQGRNAGLGIEQESLKHYKRRGRYRRNGLASRRNGKLRFFRSEWRHVPPWRVALENGAASTGGERFRRIERRDGAMGSGRRAADRSLRHGLESAFVALSVSAAERALGETDRPDRLRHLRLGYPERHQIAQSPRRRLLRRIDRPAGFPGRSECGLDFYFHAIYRRDMLFRSRKIQGFGRLPDPLVGCGQAEAEVQAAQARRADYRRIR